MRISDWSSDVCSSELAAAMDFDGGGAEILLDHRRAFDMPARPATAPGAVSARQVGRRRLPQHEIGRVALVGGHLDAGAGDHVVTAAARQRSEEHTSELQSLMRLSYAVFCLKKTKKKYDTN